MPAMLVLPLKNMALTSYHIDAKVMEAEEELIKAAQKDPRCFEPLYKKYYEPIVRFVYHRSGDKELSYDITSQVFYKALQNISKYKSTGVPFSAWLYRIASNELNQWFRQNKRAGILNIDVEGYAELKYSFSEDTSAMQDEELFNALRDLNEDELELVNMRFFEKRAFKEISEILQMNESACKMKLYRILDKLKIKLSGLNQ
jgi:RNA polymerase sigma-70 factor (ECF subfamily)